ncbi:MAG: homocysteine S-methyltransferase family protein [Alphaproteobacteria bacterium]|nr:homocysteine S-methyltransferase family protein [Alphaproteobacteria bacterium]
MTYAILKQRLDRGGVAILDGGIGTELQRRGAPMNHDAWCGIATLTHTAMLEAVHLDYISAGAEIITANTFASSRIMLEAAGCGDRVAEINRIAVETALSAREKANAGHVAVAGSLSHMVPVIAGTDDYDPSAVPDRARMADAFEELAGILSGSGCELIILEMMYVPDRIEAALAAARTTSLPVWAGLSARRGDNGAILGFSPHDDTPFDDFARIVAEAELDAAGVMHCPSNIVAEANQILSRRFNGPLMAYPDSGFFKMPDWQFEHIITPADFAAYAAEWVDQGTQIVGGCCGLSPEHIAAMSHLSRDGMA